MMSTTIAVFIATLITTGMTSAVSHELTLLGGSFASLLFAVCALVSRNAQVFPAFLFGAIALSALALVSAESNTAEFSSTIHVLSSYLALLAMAFSSADLSRFCQQFILSTNLLLTGWILYQATNVSALEAWQITNPSGAGNLMAAQVNMTLPLVLSRMTQSTGSTRLSYILLLALNCAAVFLVMSRNGIGAMLIVLTLYALFSHKRLALVVIGLIGFTAVFLDNIVRLPFMNNLLIRMRIVNFVPKAPRSVIWQISWDHILARPGLGVGPGEPRKILAVLDINHAHNNIMQVAFETGLPTAAIYVVLVVLLLWLPLRMCLSKREHFVHTLPIIAYMIFSWTGGPLTFPGATLLLAACVNEARVALSRQECAEPVWNVNREMRSLRGVSSHA